ncbi:hypothetical protein COLO4_03898 [Corchorus olitorius]|uniref:Protein kinase domain-containing protein n=1 Tax=Corchorus olitorius TaxID=93759 RepID=A0A1R3KW97_9ROSI|nr:hypothetical protein COLO4_03898 [Corchorus olitorius]
MGEPSRSLSSFFKVFTKTSGNRKSKKSEGNEKHSRIIPNPPALPDGIQRQFSLAEIRAATNNFDQDLIIGEGGFGCVYKGVIDDGIGNLTNIAVKRMKPNSDSGQGCKEFQTEVLFLCQLRHQNLVSLIGFCCDKGEIILVYEYVRNGTLRDHLYGAGGHDPLPWKQRLEICISAARGLHHLHNGLKKYGVIHRDIKSSNFLLDQHWVCKISDFGLSKIRSLDKKKALERIDSLVKGTWGYLDPEYARGQGLTEKSDVYSFGIVLFEVLCARKALDLKLNEGQVNLAHWARSCATKGTIHEIVDPYLRGGIAPECFKIFVGIALSCISDLRNNRPDIGEVEATLELALELQIEADSEMERIHPHGHGECRYEDVIFSSSAFDIPDNYRADSSGSNGSSEVAFSFNSDAISDINVSQVFQQLVN